MKNALALLIILCILLCMLFGCGRPAGGTPQTEAPGPGEAVPSAEAPLPPETPRTAETPDTAETAAPAGTPPPAASPQPEKSPILALSVVRRAAEIPAVGGVKPWTEWWQELGRISSDLSHSPGLAYSLTIGDNTVFSGGVPEGYDPHALMEWGRDPGLGVRVLHASGFTGKGAVIAYIDQPVSPREEFDGDNIHVINTGKAASSMHGPGALSLLAGKTIGTAPEAEVYFFGCDSGDGSAQLHQADALYRVIALNETLPQGEKITMVGFSDNIDSAEAYTAEFRAAVKACERAGIMVWFCWEYGAASFLPFADKNIPYNLMPDQGNGTAPALVYVPVSGRTAVNGVGDAHYVYYSTAGLSWAMPYVMGLYAIALSIDPTLTRDELRKYLAATSYTFNGECRLVNPVGFTAQVLRQAGRGSEAEALQREARAQLKVLFAVVDTEVLTEEDLQAVCDGLAWVTDAVVMVADASCHRNAADLYDAVGSLMSRGPYSLAGIQLFGDETVIPQPPEDMFPVWRLALQPGEYGAFFREYRAAAAAGEPHVPDEGVLYPLNRAAMALSEAEGSLRD